MKIKAIHPIMENVLNKMKSFIRSEIAKADFDGVDAKDVSDSLSTTQSWCP
jgi:hypothetical protein